MLIANVSPRTGGKTTASGLLAHALVEADLGPVEGVDADHSKQFWNWSQRAGFTFPVQQLATARFHKEVDLRDGVITIVDCGHSENHPDVTDSVLKVADLAILHMAPTAADFERVVEPTDATPFLDIIKRSAVFRPTQTPPPTWVLLNRTHSTAKSTGHYRSELEAEGFKVFTTVIGRSEVLAQAIGYPVVGAARSPFGALVTEMKDRGMFPS
jgi:hypothetical protein